jgi:hypothetical protein
MARVLIVGGGQRALLLGRALIAEGHALRLTTRTERRRAEIEATGAECFIGTPDRIGTLRPALDGVAVACWLLGEAGGEAESVRALHSSRLEFFLSQVIDTTVRGFVYEAAGGLPRELYLGGAELARRLCRRSAIPYRELESDPREADAWLAAARRAVAELL